MSLPPVVSPREWQAARAELLAREKAAMRADDALAAERRRQPAMAVERDYALAGPDGPASLLDLFEGRRQLIVYSFMFGPEHPEPCSGCSMFVAARPHAARPPGDVGGVARLGRADAAVRLVAAARRVRRHGVICAVSAVPYP